MNIKTHRELKDFTEAEMEFIKSEDLTDETVRKMKSMFEKQIAHLFGVQIDFIAETIDLDESEYEIID